MAERIFLLDKDTIGMFSGLYTGLLPAGSLLTEDSVALGVSSGGTLAGLLISTVTSESVWLDWLYVKEDCRESGIATRVLNHFAKHVAGTTSDNMIHVACTDEALRRVLLEFGFRFEDKVSCFMYEARISDMKDFGEVKEDPHVIPLSSIGNIALNSTGQSLLDAKDANIGIQLPIAPDEFIDGSAAYLADGKLDAGLFLKNDPKGVNIAYVFFTGGNPVNLVKVVDHAKKKILATHGSSTVVSSIALNPKSEKMMESLFPNHRKYVVYNGELPLFGW